MQNITSYINKEANYEHVKTQKLTVWTWVETATVREYLDAVTGPPTQEDVSVVTRYAAITFTDVTRNIFADVVNANTVSV